MRIRHRGRSFAGSGSRRLPSRRTSSSSGCRMISRPSRVRRWKSRWSRRWRPRCRSQRRAAPDRADGRRRCDRRGWRRPGVARDQSRRRSRDRPSGPPAQPGRDDLHRLHRPGPAWRPAPAGGGGEAGLSGATCCRSRCIRCRRWGWSCCREPGAASRSRPGCSDHVRAARGRAGSPACARRSASWRASGRTVPPGKVHLAPDLEAFLSGEEAAPWRQSLTRIGPVALMRDPALAPGSYRVEAEAWGSPGPPRGPRCPECRKPTDPRFRPFCSAYCRDRDLLRWLDGTLRRPGG